MKKKIAIIGSRELACKITKWIVDSQEVDIIGGVFPPFEGWLLHLMIMLFILFH